MVLKTTSKYLYFHHPCLFEDCIIEAKNKLVNFQFWSSVKFKRCAFRGTFRGNDFGHWNLSGFPNYGDVDSCDLREARLEGVRFLNVDMQNLKMPMWPHFTIIQPAQLKSPAKEELPKGLKAFIEMLSEEDEQVSAVTWFAPEVCRVLKCSQQAIQKTLSKLGNSVLA